MDITSKHHKCTHSIALLHSYNTNFSVLITMLIFEQCNFFITVVLGNSIYFLQLTVE